MYSLSNVYFEQEEDEPETQFSENNLKKKSKERVSTYKPFFRVSKPTARRILDPYEKRDIVEAFDYYDSDDKGYLTSFEYKLAFISLMGYRPTKYEKRETPRINKIDFVKRMAKKIERQSEYDRWKQVFNSFDSDYKGFITLADVKKVFKDVAPFVKDIIIERNFFEFDRKKNGRIVFSDFLEMMNNGKKLVREKTNIK